MQKEKASLTVVVIYVWRSKAYIPVQDQYESGIFVGTEPIYIAELKNNDLFNAVNAVKEKGHKHIPDLKSREEVLKRKIQYLLLRKQKAGSNWRVMVPRIRSVGLKKKYVLICPV
jgi:hypothetical protein